MNIPFYAATCQTSAGLYDWKRNTTILQQRCIPLDYAYLSLFEIPVVVQGRMYYTILLTIESENTSWEVLWQ